LTSDEDKYVVEGDECPNKELKDAIDLDKLRYEFKADIS